MIPKPGTPANPHDTVLPNRCCESSESGLWWEYCRERAMCSVSLWMYC
jgi:hypothetical protein